jgi:hypothetical protein
MPKVPVYQPQVQTRTETAIQPVEAAPVEAAFGANVQAATERLGEQVQKTGSVLGNRVIEMQQREDDKALLQTQAAFQADLQNTLNNPETDENGRPKGYLQRNLASAQGSTIEFDQLAPQLKQKYMQMAKGPAMQLELDKALSTHLMTARDQVSKNEGNQLDADFKQTAAATLDAIPGQAARLEDPVHVADFIKVGQSNADIIYKRLGYSPQQIEFAKEKLAGEALKAAVAGNLETSPVKARAILEANKGLIPNNIDNIQTTLDKQIDGKIIHDQELAVWDQVKGRRLSNGMIDIEAGQKYVNALTVSAERKQQLMTSVRSMASVADTEMKQKIEANDRDFTNSLISAQSKGLPYQDALILAAKHGRDATDIAQKQKDVTDLYTEKTNAFDTWIKKQPEATQAAWAYTEETVKGKYGNSVSDVPGYPNKVNLAAAALTELKQDSLGKSPDQIRSIVNEKMKNVVVKPGWLWDTKDTGWKADAGLRQGLSVATSQLEKDYGADRVSQARLYLTRHQVPITPRNVKAVLDKALNPVKE